MKLEWTFSSKTPLMALSRQGVGLGSSPFFFVFFYPFCELENTKDKGMNKRNERPPCQARSHECLVSLPSLVEFCVPQNLQEVGFQYYLSFDHSG